MKSKDLYLVGFKPILCSTLTSAQKISSLFSHSYVKTFATRKEVEDYLAKFDEPEVNKRDNNGSSPKSLSPKQTQTIKNEFGGNAEPASPNPAPSERIKEPEDDLAAQLEQTKKFLQMKKVQEENSPVGKISPSRDVYYYFLLTQETLIKSTKKINPHTKYYLFFDGAAKHNPGPAGGGFAIFDSNSSPVFQNAFHAGYRSNNEAEWLGFLYGIKAAYMLGITQIKVFGDSALVVNQIRGSFKVKAENLIPFYNEGMKLKKLFADFEIEHIPREQNTVADKLSNEGVAKYKEFLEKKGVEERAKPLGSPTMPQTWPKYQPKVTKEDFSKLMKPK